MSDRRHERVPKEAYDLFLKARDIVSTFRPGQYRQALSDLEGAIKLDTAFADAHAELAFASYVVWVRSWAWIMPPPAALQRAQQAAARSMALDPENASARVTMALIEQRHDRHDEAIRLARMAAKLFPGDALTQFKVASLLAESDELQESARALETAMKLEPRPSAYQNFLNARTWGFLHQYDKAVQALLAARRQEPKMDLVSLYLAQNYGHLGKIENAKEEPNREITEGWAQANLTYIRNIGGIYVAKTTSNISWTVFVRPGFLSGPTASRGRATSESEAKR